MQAYKNTKDTGVAWLGKVPASWDILSPKVVFKERKNRSRPEDIHLTPSQKFGVLPQSDYMERTGNRVVLNLSGSDNMKHVEKGDFIIHLRSFQGGIEYSGYSGKVSNAYTVIEPSSSLHYKFYKYALKSQGYISDLASTTDQLRDGQSIKFSTFNLVKLPVPDLRTQKDISLYLDREIEKIDQLINKQEKLISLLKEHKDAKINQLVLNGVLADLKTRNSGIPWLGEIPAHWDTPRSSVLFKEVKEKNANLDSKIPVKFKYGEIVAKDIELDENALNEIKRYVLIRENDVLINGLNLNYDFVTQRVALSKIDGCITPAYIVLRPRKDVINPLYITHLLKSLDSQKILNGWGTGIRLTLNFSELKKVQLALPPLDEQLMIVEEINKTIHDFNNLNSLALNQVELLKERRVSLIAHAVTGKIKAQ